MNESVNESKGNVLSFSLRKIDKNMSLLAMLHDDDGGGNEHHYSFTC